MSPDGDLIMFDPPVMYTGALNKTMTPDLEDFTEVNENSTMYSPIFPSYFTAYTTSSAMGFTTTKDP